jgi:hypothetical protein
MSDQEQVVELPTRVVAVSAEGCCYGCFCVKPKTELPGSLCLECTSARQVLAEAATTIEE